MDADDEGRRWLRAHRGGAATADALAFFDRCPPVAPAALVGRWRGTGLPTGHPFDGLLEGYGWDGQDRLAAEPGPPLLSRAPRGGPRRVAPAPAPLALRRRPREPARRTIARLAWPGVRALRRTRRPAARVRTVD